MKIDFGALVTSAFFGFLAYAFFNFLLELWFQQAWLNSIWFMLSFQQRALENINLGLMDLKLMLTALCLIFFGKFAWGD